MNPSFTLLAFFGSIAIAQAQPTITAQNAPVPGTNYTLHFGPYVDPGSAGANQTWDFSGLTTDSTMNIMLVEPNTVPGFESFPGATVAEVGNEAVMFWRTDADGIYHLGSLSEGVAISYFDEGKYFEYPCTYQTSWEDSVFAIFEVEEENITRDGLIQGEADGYGTVIMPNGTYNNVLRVRWLENTTDATDFFEINSVYDSYLFYLQGQSYPLAHIVTATISFMGNETTTQFTQWYTGDLTTGVTDAPLSQDEMMVWPNPADEQVRIQLPANMKGETFIQVMDATGKTAHTARFIPDANGALDLSVSDLVTGLYFVNAIDAKGNKATVRLVVN